MNRFSLALVLAVCAVLAPVVHRDFRDWLMVRGWQTKPIAHVQGQPLAGKKIRLGKTVDPTESKVLKALALEFREAGATVTEDMTFEVGDSDLDVTPWGFKWYFALNGQPTILYGSLWFGGQIAHTVTGGLGNTITQNRKGVIQSKDLSLEQNFVNAWASDTVDIVAYLVTNYKQEPVR